MGKGKRLKLKRKQEAESVSKIMITGQGLEPLTDELIERLSKEKGMPIADLKDLQKDGYQYSPSRGSFFAPPEINTP